MKLHFMPLIIWLSEDLYCEWHVGMQGVDEVVAII
jgi:hypothetical protein